MDLGLHDRIVLVTGASIDRRLQATYPTHFDVAWKMAVQAALSGDSDDVAEALPAAMLEVAALGATPPQRAGSSSSPTIHTDAIERGLRSMRARTSSTP